MRFIGACLGFIFILLSSGQCFAKGYIEGKDYTELKVPIEETASVIEFFSYACPYCYRAEPLVESLAERLAEQGGVERVPVSFGRTKYKNAALSFFIVQEMDIGIPFEVLHRHIYELHHSPVGGEWRFDGLSFEEDFYSLLGTLGGDPKLYKAVKDRVQKQRMIELAEEKALKYKVTATPTFVVRGKYVFQGIDEGPLGRAKLEEKILYLLNK